MRKMSSDAPQLHPSRRTVLKVSANAAWAVPAIQIATAAPSFAAASDASQVTVEYLSQTQTGGSLAVTVRVTSKFFGTKGVNLIPGGDVTSTTPIAVGNLALNTPKTVTATVALKPNGAGAVTLTATGTTDNAAGKAAVGGATAAFAAAVLTIDVTHHAYDKGGSPKTGTLSFGVTSSYAAAEAVSWTVTPVKTPATASATTASGIAIASGATKAVGPLTYTWTDNSGDRTFAIVATGKTVKAPGATATQNAVQANVAATNF